MLRLLSYSPVITLCTDVQSLCVPLLLASSSLFVPSLSFCTSCLLFYTSWIFYTILLHLFHLRYHRISTYRRCTVVHRIFFQPIESWLCRAWLRGWKKQLNVVKSIYLQDKWDSCWCHKFNFKQLYRLDFHGIHRQRSSWAVIYLLSLPDSPPSKCFFFKFILSIAKARESRCLFNVRGRQFSRAACFLL